MNKTRYLRAASVQFQHLAGDKSANLEKIRGFVARAAAERVELIAFPEMCITGYWHLRNLSREAMEALAEPVPEGPTARLLMALSREYRMTIGAGLMENRAHSASRLVVGLLLLNFMALLL